MLKQFIYLFNTFKMSDFVQDSCWLPVFACFFLSILFVGSLYVWQSRHDRNHPSTIKQRFCSIFFVILISPFILKFFITSSHFKQFTIFELIGFRLAGLIPAAVLPLLLTMVLFLGPLCMKYEADSWKSFLNSNFWTYNVKNLIWLRNIIVGPLAEEFTFRACMLPLLVQCLKPSSAIFVCCFFFGLAHIHHMVEMYKAGDPIRLILLGALIQFSYTTLFGAYSAYVFLQTGHFIASFIVHAFCNIMGLPDFNILFTCKNPKKSILLVLHIVGIILWYVLSLPLLNHTWYDNYVYFDEVNIQGALHENNQNQK